MTLAYNRDATNPNRVCGFTMERIKRLGKDYQLLFFFNGNCQQSRALALIVQQFIQIYGWGVWAISLNGASIPEFPTPHINKKLAHKFQLKVIPALIALHSHSKFYVPISYGYSSLDDIESELEILANHEEWRKG